jgi:hypothetical protein
MKGKLFWLVAQSWQKGGVWGIRRGMGYDVVVVGNSWDGYGPELFRRECSDQD